MRKIGTLDDARLTERFADHLTAQHMEHSIEANEAGAWDVWIHDDAQLDGARRQLHDFLADPDAETFIDATPMAEDISAEEALHQGSYERNMRRARHAMSWSWIQLTPVTNVLILLAALVTALTGFGTQHHATQPFLISGYEVRGDYIHYESDLPEIRAGQVWRLLTPIFLHFDLLHLLLNLWWMRDLGTAVERNSGRRTLIGLVLVIAVLSNLGQFYSSGPSFGGLSGIVFGLLGYAWLRGKYDLTSGLYVPPRTATMMVIWFFVCMTGAVGPIANVVHGVGLSVGLVWGYAAARWTPRRGRGHSE